MKRIFAPIAAIAAVIALSIACSKDDDNLNVAAKRYFDAWMSVHHPDAQKSGHGIYILEDIPGSGKTITASDLDEKFVFVRYTSYTLDGTISETTEEDIAKQAGTYSLSTYYGPVAWACGDGYLQRGLMDLLTGMNVGGTRTAVIPGWLTDADAVYDTEEQYLKKASGDNVIYTVTLCDTTEDIVEWETSALLDFIDGHMADADSIDTGIYYKRLLEPTDTVSLAKDTTIYVNYIGRLLNGTIFDTNIADTAKVHGIYSASKTYEPTLITCAEEYTDITMGSEGSSTVTGFSYGISLMHSFEAGRVAFISDWGYGYTGSSPSIPAFAPLIFDLYIVDEPED